MAELEIRIAKPCKQSWTSMKGDERVRFCGACQKSVFNISEMTRDEVETLIRETNGVFCARLYRRSDQRVMTKDCPKGVAAYRRRGVFALAAAGAAMVYGIRLLPTPRQELTGDVAVPPQRAKPAAPVPDYEIGDAALAMISKGKR